MCESWSEKQTVISFFEVVLLSQRNVQCLLPLEAAGVDKQGEKTSGTIPATVALGLKGLLIREAQETSELLITSNQRKTSPCGWNAGEGKRSCMKFTGL